MSPRKLKEGIPSPVPNTVGAPDHAQGQKDLQNRSLTSPNPAMVCLSVCVGSDVGLTVPSGYPGLIGGLVSRPRIAVDPGRAAGKHDKPEIERR